MGTETIPVLSADYPSATSVQLTWSTDGAPQSLDVVDFCRDQTFMSLKQAIGTGQLIENLPVGEPYSFIVVARYADGKVLKSNIINRYSSQSCSGVVNTGGMYPMIGAASLPKTVSKPNRIVITCTNAGLYDHWMMMVDGVQSPDQTGDTYTIQPTTPGQRITISTNGQFKTDSDYSGWATSMTVQAVGNIRSVAEFLSISAASGAGGLRKLMGGGRSVRGWLGV